MIVTITSWAPVLAFSQPTMPPQMPPPMMPPSIATTRWITGGRCKVKPTYAARMAPEIAWPWAPMLNRPARKARPTPSPAQISGAACAVVSVIGPIPPIAPLINAPYALLTFSQEAISASDGLGEEVR